MGQIENILDMEAENQADIDDFADSKADEAYILMSSLLNSIDERDSEIYAHFEADPLSTIEDYQSMAIMERGLGWLVDMSAQFAAARMQTWIEVYGVEFLAMAEANGRKVEGISQSMSKGDLLKAGKIGVGKERFDNAKIKRKQQG